MPDVDIESVSIMSGVYLHRAQQGVFPPKVTEINSFSTKVIHTQLNVSYSTHVPQCCIDNFSSTIILVQP